MKYNNKIALALLSLVYIACGGGGEKETTAEEKKEAPQSMYQKALDPLENPGIGPVKELTFSADIDQTLAQTGKELYEIKCTACHKADQKYIGPAPKGIYERRNPAWVMNMILNPEQMVAEDPIAKKLLMEFNGSPMANQGLTETEARAIAEYFRTL